MKYILILMMIVTSLSSEQAKDLFLKKPKYFTYEINGSKHYCFNLDNMKILKAKHMVIKDLFLPVTNSYYSNLVLDNTTMAGDIWLLEGQIEDLKKKQLLKEKIKTYGLIATITIAIIEGVIISLK